MWQLNFDGRKRFFGGKIQIMFSPINLALEGMKIQCVSRAGIGTSFFLPELDTCIDVAQGLPFHLFAQDYFITHSHMDHASGIPYLISQRALNKIKDSTFYMPESMVGPMDQIMKLWGQLEKHEYSYRFIPIKPGEEVTIKNGKYHVRAFETLHRVPSQGYTVFEIRKKLRSKYSHLHESQLIELRNEGREVSEVISIPRFSYTGDTQIEFLDLSPEVKNSQVLAVEVTYFDDKRPVNKAREWGHIHFDEFLVRLPELNCKKILLVHPSRRYRDIDISQIIQARLPVHERERVQFLYANEI